MEDRGGDWMKITNLHSSNTIKLFGLSRRRQLLLDTLPERFLSGCLVSRTLQTSQSLHVMIEGRVVVVVKFRFQVACIKRVDLARNLVFVAVLARRPGCDG